MVKHVLLVAGITLFGFNASAEPSHYKDLDTQGRSGQKLADAYRSADRHQKKGDFDKAHKIREHAHKQHQDRETTKNVAMSAADK